MKKTVRIFCISLLSLLAICVAVFCLYAYFLTKNTDLDDDKLPKTDKKCVVLDANGNAMTAETGLLELSEMNDYLNDAFIAVEDKRFYSHKGYDIRRIVGAAAKNMQRNQISQGASTITQQVIKNTQLSPEKTFARKLKELKLARKLEKRYEKKDILLMYQNVAYFGGGNYGVKSAAHAYFGKEVSELTPAECAILAGTVKNPSRYSPVNTDNANSRKNLVLQLMCEQKLISEELRDQAQNQYVVPIESKNETKLNVELYAEEAKKQAAELMNIKLAAIDGTGAKIHTYYSTDKQATLESRLKRDDLYAVNQNDQKPEIVAMLAENSGGISAVYSTIPNPFSVKRQCGSVLKPLAVYLPVLENLRLYPATEIEDIKTDFGGYSPKNYNDIYRGSISMRESLAYSSNVCACKLLSYLGTEKATSFLQKFGIEAGDNVGYSLALGVTENGVTFSGLLNGYVMLANGGKYREIGLVRSIELENKTIYPNADEQLASEENAYLLTDMLQCAAEYGTAKTIGALGLGLAAKTGTVGNSDGNSDAYCISYSNENTLMVWHGTEDGSNKMCLAETGGSYVAASAREVWKSLNATQKQTAVKRPNGIVNLEIDTYSLRRGSVLLATQDTPPLYRKAELFNSSNLPNNTTLFDDISTLLKAEYVGGSVKLSFSAKEFVKYRLIREQRNYRGEQTSTMISEFFGKDGTVEYIDRIIGTNRFIKYRLESMLEKDGMPKVGIPSVCEIYAEFQPIIDFR